MFNNPPKIFAHITALKNGNFVLPEYILNPSGSEVNLFHRYCPHRMYPLHSTGEHVKEISCKFHNFKWNEDGTPINNTKKLHCGNANIGKSGLIFKNFIEPNHKWVDILANETDLEYSHTCQGASKGSWLWMLEIQADLFHIRKGGVHPGLSEETNLDEVTLDQGNGWVIQYCSTGFWLVVYPYTFVEWSLGCLAVNYTTPNDTNNEFGFTWNTQFYYSPQTSEEKRRQFETLEDVFREDVGVIEKQKGQYFPLMKSVSPLEDHCVHFGKWVKENLTK